MATKLGRVLPSGRGEFIGKEEAQGNPHEGPGTVFAPTHVVATCISAHVSLLNSGSEFTLYNACSCCCLVAQLHLTLCEPVDCSTPGFPILHHLPEFAQTQVHWVSDAIQPSHPLSSRSPAFNLSQHQGPFQWVSSLHQVAKGLELRLQHQSFQWIFRVDFL